MALTAYSGAWKSTIATFAGANWTEKIGSITARNTVPNARRSLRLKKYDAKKIFHYVSVHKSDLEKIDVGIAEDWLQTNQRVYADGRLLIDIPRGDNDLYLRQVRGSTWGTPIMRVVYKDGTVNVLNCYKTDKKEMPPTQVAKIVAEYKNRGVKMMGWDGVLR